MGKSLLLIAFILLVPIASDAQSYLRYSRHSIAIKADTLQLFQEAAFTFGSGSVCPSLIHSKVHIQGNRIIVDVIYDCRGGWPQYGCVQHDTLEEWLPKGGYTLVVNTFLQLHDSLGTGLDTLSVDSDTTQNVILHLPNFDSLPPRIDFFPNPFNEFLQLQISQNEGIGRIKLLNASGEVIKVLPHGEEILEVSEIPEGVYLLHIQWNGRSRIIRVVKN